jgi:hypothetical protein
VSIFDQFLNAARPTPPEPARAAWLPPESVLPAVVPVDLVLVRTDEIAVAIPSVRAYPTGFDFQVSVRLRRDHGPQLGMALHGPLGHTSADDIFRLAVVFADGRVLSNLGPLADPGASPEHGILMPGGGGGGGRSYDLDYWVHPLPPPGRLTFVCEWPSFAVPQTEADLDAAAILAASARAQPLWPETSDSAYQSRLSLGFDAQPGDGPSRSGEW